jgi:hypothetical protein
MTLPKKEEKSYLKIERVEKGFCIVAKKPDADALAALFLQYGISCRREPDIRPDEDALQFFDGVKQEQVEQILNGYRTPKGS